MRIALPLAAAVLALSACTVDAEEPAKQTAQEESSLAKGESGKSKPKPADKNTVGAWKIIGKIKPTPDQYGSGDFAARFRVTNTGDADLTPVFTLNVLNGQTLMAALDCYGNATAPGATATVECTSLDKFKKGWTSVELEDSSY